VRLRSPLPLITLALVLAVALLSLARQHGLLQFLELAAYDLMVATLDTEADAQPIVTLVVITETDVQTLGNWPLTDAQLGDALAPLMGDMSAWEVVLGLIAEVMRGIAESIDQIAAAAEWAAPKIEQLATILEQLKTIIDEIGTGGALKAIGQEIVGTNVEKHAAAWGVNAGGRTRQFGGPVAAHQTYLVGERGPELFVPGQSGQVVAGGQVTVDVPIVLQLDGEVIARALGRRAARFATTGAAARL